MHASLCASPFPSYDYGVLLCVPKYNNRTHTHTNIHARRHTCTHNAYTHIHAYMPYALTAASLQLWSKPSCSATEKTPCQRRVCLASRACFAGYMFLLQGKDKGWLAQTSARLLASQGQGKHRFALMHKLQRLVRKSRKHSGGCWRRNHSHVVCLFQHLTYTCVP